MIKKYVSWRRVSTKRQGASGLGLDAQKEIIRYFIERDGGEWIADYSECYTGTELSGCTELWKAIDYAKSNDAILIIAKTDRFRNTIEALQVYDKMGDGRIMFCDLPHTDKFTLTLFFALAEREALIVSIRTKQALAAKKERGEVTGGASEAWRSAFENKSKDEIKKEYMERGKLRNERYLQSRDVQVFLKVLRNVFKDVCVTADASAWDWTRITTAGDNKDNMWSLMRDYKEMDDTGATFAKWNFDEADAKKRQVKLAAYIQTIRKSLEYNKRFNTNANE